MRVLLISRAVLASAYRGRVRKLAKFGVDLTVIVPQGWEYQQFECQPQEEGYHLRVCQTGLAWASLGKLANHTFYYKDLSMLAADQSWDVVHIDEEPFNFACYHAQRIFSRNRAKLVFFSWQNIFKTYPPPFDFFEESVFRHACGAIAGNAEAKEVLYRRRFRKPVKVIPQFGVDTDVSLKLDRDRIRRELGVEGLFAVGYIGRIVREKGLDILVNAFSRLSSDSILILVGEGSFQRTLGRMTRALGVAGRVRWVPWVSSEDVVKYMTCFDALVLPSRTTRHWKEQLGRVLLEAMACETCVVGSDSGEIPNVIGETGLVFHEGNELELAECLKRLMQDTSLRDLLGKRGRERVLERFTNTKIARDTLSFYEEICDGDGAEARHENSDSERLCPR